MRDEKKMGKKNRGQKMTRSAEKSPRHASPYNPLQYVQKENTPPHSRFFATGSVTAPVATCAAWSWSAERLVLIARSIPHRPRPWQAEQGQAEQRGYAFTAESSRRTCATCATISGAMQSGRRIPRGFNRRMPCAIQPLLPARFLQCHLP